MPDIAKEVKLLLLYQGDEGAKFADAMIAPLTKEMPGDIQAITKQVGFNKNTSNDFVFNLLLKDIACSDACLAIIAIDERAASEAGNIWFEIGWWYARKNPASLLICVQDHEKVREVTNVLGKLVPRFKTVEDLVGHAKDLVREVGDRKYPRAEDKTPSHNGHCYSSNLKIRDTLGGGKWKPDSAHLCEHLAVDGQQAECPFRQASTVLIAELMRMGRANRENTEIQCALYKFAQYAEDVRNTEYLEFYRESAKDSEISRTKERQELFVHMVNALSELFDAVEELVLPRKALYSDEANDVWEKLRFWMDYRILNAISHWKELDLKAPKRPTLTTMRERTRPFTEWARALLDGDYADNAYFLQSRSASPSADTEADLIHKYGLLARDMAQLLENTSEKYFRQCRDAMRAVVAGNTDPFEEPTRAFQTMSNTLPHNQPTFRMPQIWPDEKEQQRRA